MTTPPTNPEVTYDLVAAQEADLTSDTAALLLNIPRGLEHFNDPSAYYQGVRDLTGFPYLHRAETAHSLGGTKAMATLTAEYFVLNRVSDSPIVSTPESVARTLEEYGGKIIEAGVTRTRTSALQLLIDGLESSVDEIRMTTEEATYTKRVIESLALAHQEQRDRKQKLALAVSAAIGFGVYLYRRNK